MFLSHKMISPPTKAIDLSVVEEDVKSFTISDAKIGFRFKGLFEHNYRAL